MCNYEALIAYPEPECCMHTLCFNPLRTFEIGHYFKISHFTDERNKVLGKLGSSSWITEVEGIGLGLGPSTSKALGPTSAPPTTTSSHPLGCKGSCLHI